MSSSEPTTTGHRTRLKARFTQGEGTGLADYELLELALTFSIPRKDTKPLAKQLLKAFGNLSGVLSAPAEKLTHITGCGESTATLLRLIHTLAKRIGREELSNTSNFADHLTLLEYLYTHFSGKTREEFHTLYLNAKMELIQHETTFTGTLNESIAAPRDILKRALEVNAAGVIVTHNHPSGNPTPSPEDHVFTYQLAELCPTLGLILHDHIIIGQESHYSFKGAGVL